MQQVHFARSSVAFITCGICAELFCARSKRAKTCRSEPCQRRAKANRMREYFRSKGGNPYRTKYPYTCADCGIASTSQAWKTERCLSCANRRRSAGWNERRPKKSAALVGPVAPDLPIVCTFPDRHPARRKPQKPRTWYAGSCAHCGVAFVDLQPKARYCSRGCGSSAGKRRRGYFSPSPCVRTAIYERDGWVCQLCLEPVDRSLHPSDVWAATLDHIVCQAWGEKPDHSPSNLRLAHRWCNSVRGDETYYTAADLVA